MVIGVDGFDCHGNKLSPVGQAAMNLAMCRLNDALTDPVEPKGGRILFGAPAMPQISKDGDVLLSKLKHVPKMSRKKLRKIIDSGRVSPFTMEVLHFVADYRGTNVENFKENLKVEMRRKIWDHGLANKRGIRYSVSSIHTLIKKALIYTEL